MCDWEDDVQVDEPMDFRDLTTFDGQDADDEQTRDRELECLSDHEAVADLAMPPEEAAARVCALAAGRAAGATSGHEAEHPGPDQPPAGGTSGWEAEQDRPDRPAETGERQGKGEES